MSPCFGSDGEKGGMWHCGMSVASHVRMPEAAPGRTISETAVHIYMNPSTAPANWSHVLTLQTCFRPLTAANTPERNDKRVCGNTTRTAAAQHGIQSNQTLPHHNAAKSHEHNNIHLSATSRHGTALEIVQSADFRLLGVVDAAECCAKPCCCCCCRFFFFFSSQYYFCRLPHWPTSSTTTS